MGTRASEKKAVVPRFAKLGIIVLAFVLAATGCARQTTEQPAAEHQKEAIPLPDSILGTNVQEAGLDLASVQLAADTGETRVWTARGGAQDICLVMHDEPTDTGSVGCAPQHAFVTQGAGLALSLADDQGLTGEAIHAYLLPDGADANTAARMLPDAAVFGQLILQRGVINSALVNTIAVPSEDGDVQLLVFGPLTQ